MTVKCPNCGCEFASEGRHPWVVSDEAPSVPAKLPCPPPNRVEQLWTIEQAGWQSNLVNIACNGQTIVRDIRRQSANEVIDAHNGSLALPDKEKEDDCHLRGSVEVTVFRDGKVLAVNSRNFDGFCGVGGKVESGESFEHAARRELLEETGCEALSIKFIAGHTLEQIKGDDDSVRWYCAGFVVDIGEQEPRANEAGTTPFWTTKEELIEHSLFPKWYAWWFGILKPASEHSAHGGQDALSFDFAPWRPPFHYFPLGSDIRDSAGQKCLDIRGWGFLTGRGGGLAMDEDKAAAIQDALGEHVVALLNGT